MSVAGVDVSNWQGRVGWDAVAGSGVQFAFAKASEGTTYSDSWFVRNWSEMQRVGLVRGAYHFAQPDQGEPEAQADFFLDHVLPLSAGDLLAGDFEAGTGDVSAWALRFLQHVEARAGFKPLLYSGLWFMQPHRLLTLPALAEYGLWLAAYQAIPPVEPPPWPFVAIWQSTSKATVPGVAGPCDADTFNGTREQLALYGLPTSAADPRDAEIQTLTAQVQTLTDTLAAANGLAARQHAALSQINATAAAALQG